MRISSRARELRKVYEDELVRSGKDSPDKFVSECISDAWEAVYQHVRSAAFGECAEIAVQLLGAEGTAEGAAFADGHSSAQETIARRIRERKDRDA